MRTWPLEAAHKAGGHGLSHDPKITADMKIPLEPNLFWKSCLGPAGAATRSWREEESLGRQRSGWRLLWKRTDRSVGGGVWPGTPWDALPGRAQVPARDTR